MIVAADEFAVVVLGADERNSLHKRSVIGSEGRFEGLDLGDECFGCDLYIVDQQTINEGILRCLVHT